MMVNRKSYHGFFIKVFIFVFTAIILLGIIKNVKASVVPGSTGQLTCTSVCINENDSLWSIAEEYYSDDFESIQNYIEIIKETNNLKSYQINKGCYLIIPYYN